MILSDRTVKERLSRGDLVVRPLDLGDIQPASVDLRLGRYIRVYSSSTLTHIDVRRNLAGLTERVEVVGDVPFILHPRQFVLGSTHEWVELPDDVVARLEGKSSLGRLGLVIHSTAGFIDPGWRGTITLELSNNAPLPITLYRGMPICQLSFMQLSTPADRPYGSPGLGSRYQGQAGPTASRYTMGRAAGRRGRSEGGGYD